VRGQGLYPAGAVRRDRSGDAIASTGDMEVTSDEDFVTTL
jgi:hypothetical protein